MDRLSSIDASFLTNETSSAHMHVGAILIFEGPPPALRGLPRSRAQPPAPGAAVPSEARLSAHRDGPAVLGGRPPLPPRLPRAPLGAAGAGVRGAAPQHRGPALLAGARPLEAALGALAHPGAREEPIRAGDQDPPRPGGRRLGRRHRHGPLRRQARARADRARPRTGCHSPPHLPPSSRPAARWSSARRPSSSPAAPSAPRPSHANHPQGRRGRRGARRGGLELHQPGAGGTAQHRDRIPPPVRLDPFGARATSSGSRTPRRHGQRRRAGRGQRRARGAGCAAAG